MTGLVLQILFYDDKAYLTRDRAMTFAQLGLPPIAKFFKSPAIWTIRVIRYIQNENKIFCNIIAYQSGETDFGYEQVRLADLLNTLETVTFRSIDTDSLFKTLAGTLITSFTPSTQAPVIRDDNRHIIKSDPTRKTIKETFYFPIKNVHFKNGGVYFNAKINGLNKPLEININNYCIIEEFDAVKNYIANVLGTKNIQVVAQIELNDGKITSLEISSPEISRIDSGFFEKVKFEALKSFINKKVGIETEKAMFTIEEYFEEFAEEQVMSNTFYTDPNELFEDVLKISHTKHYRHLRFLSSKHSHELMKLRFVHNPFSFIFLINGENSYHIIWETLDTAEATYIWHIDKNPELLEMTLVRIDQIINMIKSQGRKAYLNSINDQFSRVFHDYSENIEGFVKWKAELEKTLT